MSRRGSWGRALALAAVGLALVLTGAVLGRSALRGLIGAILAGLMGSITRLPALLAVDPAGTLREVLVVTVTELLLILPPLRYFTRAPRRRLVWVPLWLSALALPAAVAPLGISLVGKQIALAATAGLGWWGATRRGWGWLAFLPMLVALHPTITTHGGPPVLRFMSASSLAARCAARAGTLPRNLSVEQMNPRHYAVTPIDADRLVLTGEHGSYRLQRQADGRFVFDSTLGFSGDLWQGSIGEGRIFFTHRGSGLVSMPVEAVDGAARVERRQVPPLPGAPPELDMLDAVYEPSTRSVFVSEMVRGGAWQISLVDGAMRHHGLDAFYLQLVRREPDDMLIGISTTDLLVFDPRRGVVSQRTAAAIGAGGLDVCQRDGSAAVVDLAGRLRLFRLDESGQYVFDRGVSLSAPRRVAFSPDGAWIAVTSADDKTAYVLRRDDLSVWRTFELGPGLRDVVYTGPREVAIVDACTVNTLPGGAP
ncbi:MAG: hypothetical protein ABI629_13925 [bacterium]